MVLSKQTFDIFELMITGMTTGATLVAGAVAHSTRKKSNHELLNFSGSDFVTGPGLVKCGAGGAGPGRRGHSSVMGLPADGPDAGRQLQTGNY